MFTQRPLTMRHYVVIVGAVLLLLLLWPGMLTNLFRTQGYEDPYLTPLFVMADTLIGLAYYGISIGLVYFVHKTRTAMPFNWVFLSFGIFIIACGTTHFVDVLNIWIPAYWASGYVRLATMIASVVTAIALPPVFPRVIALMERGKLADKRRAELEAIQIRLEREIVERKRMEVALRQRELQLQSIMSNYPGGGIFLFDHDLRYVSVDGKDLRLLGYQPETMIGKTMGEILSTDTYATVEPLCRRALAGEEFSLARPYLTQHFLHVYTPVRDSNGQIIYGMTIVQNITDLHNVRESLQQTIVELDKTNNELQNANDEIQQFAYIVSHDLRAPLINLRGFADMMETSISELRTVLAEHNEAISEGGRRAIDDILQQRIPTALRFISSSVERMDRLTAAILKLSRIGHRAITISRVSSREIVESIIESLSSQFTHQQVVVEIGDLPELDTDPLALDQILGNIITNAAHYLDPQRSGKIRIAARQTETETVFEIEDNGRGIRQQDYDRVFAPFRRAGQVTVEGEGMGLAYVRALLRRLGGQIDFTSQVGVGTTFTVVLPSTK
jgi:PAS domain S-box-containing protein